MMIQTNELERLTTKGTSYLQFSGTDARRTEIVMAVFAVQLTSGENLIGQGVQFLIVAGISTNLAFSLNMVLSRMFIIGTFFSWILLYYFGRRTLYTLGMATMATVLVVIGGLGSVKPDSTHYLSAVYAIGSLLIGLNFIYHATLGPICYTLIGEVSATRLRQKSVALSRVAYQITNILWSVHPVTRRTKRDLTQLPSGIIVPRMLSPTSWNWGAKSGFFFAGTAGLSTLYCYLRLPETKSVADDFRSNSAKAVAQGKVVRRARPFVRAQGAGLTI